jgi:hypothetical protein
VFTPYYRNPDVPAKLSYCRHDALLPRFTCIDGRWCLNVSPTYHHTRDGREPSLFADELLSGLITTVSKWCDGVVGLWDDR